VVQRFWLLWNPLPDTGGLLGRLVGVPLVVGNLLAVWGVFALGRERSRRALAMLLLGLAVFATGIILARAISRYKATIEPAVVLLATGGAADILARLRRKRLASIEPIQELGSAAG
jgi:hypothetical protein